MIQEKIVGFLSRQAQKKALSTYEVQKRKKKRKICIVYIVHKLCDK